MFVRKRVYAVRYGYPPETGDTPSWCIMTIWPTAQAALDELSAAPDRTPELIIPTFWDVAEADCLRLPGHLDLALVIYPDQEDGELAVGACAGPRVVITHTRGQTLPEILLKILYKSVKGHDILTHDPYFPDREPLGRLTTFLMDLYALVADQPLHQETRTAIEAWVSAASQLFDSAKQIEFHLQACLADSELQRASRLSAATMSPGFMVVRSGYPDNPHSIWPTQETAQAALARVQEQDSEVQRFYPEPLDPHILVLTPAYSLAAMDGPVLALQERTGGFFCAVFDKGMDKQQIPPTRYLCASAHGKTVAQAILATLPSIIQAGIWLFPHFGTPSRLGHEVLVAHGHDLPEILQHELADFTQLHQTAATAQRQACHVIQKHEGFVPTMFEGGTEF